MAQDITLLGVDYVDVPAVELPKTGGGTARFTDVTPVTAEDEDVAEGKIYVKSNGELSTGTSSGGGGGGTGYDEVVFFDWDNTTLYEYTFDEAKALTELPSAPVHSEYDLMFQGWNHTLEQIKADATAKIPCYVGTMYMPDSDSSVHDTRIFCSFTDPDNLTVTFQISPYINGSSSTATVSIDWGDGATSTISGNSVSSLKSASHTYASVGDYEIRLTRGSSSTRYGFAPGYTSYSDGKKVAAIRHIFFGGDARFQSPNFEYCANLKAISIPSFPEAFASNLCYGDVSLESFAIPLRDGKSPTLGNSAFYGCSSLKRVSFPKTLKTIDGSAFGHCASLECVNIPDSVTSISTYAFAECTSLKYAKWSASCATVSTNSFSNCHNLLTVVLPENVTTIGSSAFYCCNNLANINLPSTLTTIDSSAFAYCASLTEIEIPNSVTSIGSNAFEYCYKLVSIALPEGILAVNNYMFRCCYNLKSVIIPDSVTSIGTYAFYQCHSLESITIPDSVTSIGTYVFYQCQGLREIHFKSTTPPTISNSNVWSGMSVGYKVYVPAGTLEAYTTATNYPSSSVCTYIEE